MSGTDRCFQSFGKWKGFVPEGRHVNFLGAMAKDSYVQFGDPSPPSGGRIVDTDYPSAGEEYFEWVDLLESVLSAKDEFVFMELGAGYGRWSVNAALAAKQLGKSYRILAVEPEPTHFAWLKENVEANGLDLSKCELVEAAVSPDKGGAEFYVGNPASWYGQAIRASGAELTDDMKKQGVSFEKVGTVTLSDFIGKYGMTDLLDMDVQAAEFQILQASGEMINRSVRRIHVGTHSHEIETNLRQLFNQLGWKSKYDFQCVGDRETPIGVVSFLDGVQTWINPAFE